MVLSLWFWLVPEPTRISLQAHDFAAHQRGRPGWDDDRSLTLAEFIRRKTDGLVVDVGGTAWQELTRALEEIARGADKPAGIPGEVGTRHGGRSLYLRPSEGPLDEASPLVSDRRPLVYLRVAGDTPAWLTATYRPGGDSAAVEPSSIFHPRRHLALWTLLVALLVYLLLPRPERRADTIRCRPAAAVVLPDLVGVILLGGLFGISLLLAGQMASTGSPLASDWLVPSLIIWLLAAFGLAVFSVACWYAALRFRLGEEQVRRITLFGDEERRYDEIVSADVAAARAPQALGWAGALAGLFQWRGLGPVLLASSRTDQVFEVRFRDGGRWRVSLSAIEEPQRLVQALSPGEEEGGAARKEEE